LSEAKRIVLEFEFEPDFFGTQIEEIEIIFKTLNELINVIKVNFKKLI